MLTKLQAFSSWTDATELTLDDAGREETDLIQIRNIDGLDPVKATVNTSPFGSVDGVAYTGSDVADRNIVLTLHPNPDWKDWTFEKLRRLLYSYFMPKLQTQLIFYSDDIPPVEIFGIVEDASINPFASDLEMQVSIICPDPYFTAVDSTVITGNATRDNSTPVSIEYNGSIATGFNVQLNRDADPAPTTIGVQVGDPGVSYFNVAATVDASNYFEANSLTGNKYVRNVNRTTGVIANLLSKISQGSTWPILQPGTNKFSMITDKGSQDWTLTYYARYGGL